MTDNYLYPIFHLTLRAMGFTVGKSGRSLARNTRSSPTGPIIGTRRRLVPGHDRFFAAWPIFFNARIGHRHDESRAHRPPFLPLYSSYQRLRCAIRTTAPWPLGFTYTVDREKKYHEWGAPWPFIVFARGEGKTTSRVWPFFSQAHTDHSGKRLVICGRFTNTTGYKSEPLERDRTRILLFLYSDTSREKSRNRRKHCSRRDFWPLYTWRRDLDGNQRLQVLSILEPLLPNNKSIERNYSPLWSLWRAEQNPGTGAHEPVAVVEPLSSGNHPAREKSARSCSVFLSINPTSEGRALAAVLRSRRAESARGAGQAAAQIKSNVSRTSAK